MSQIESRLNRIDQRLLSLNRVEKHLEKIAEKDESELSRVAKEEAYIEKKLVRLGNFTIKRSHVMELARGTAGAFLGIGLGQVLGGSTTLAHKLPWINIFGILAFVLVLVSILIYKNDKSFIHEGKTGTVGYIASKVFLLYCISLAVLLLALVLFNDFQGLNLNLVKVLLVGSYPAMAGAAAFTIK